MQYSNNHSNTPNNHSNTPNNSNSNNNSENPSGSSSNDHSNSIEGDSLEFTLHSRSTKNLQPDNTNPPIALLPFGVRDVFLPGMTKSLHFYEARWLRMFEEVLATPSRQFAHVIVAPERQAMAAHAVLVRILDWRRMDLGVKVKIAGIGRVKVGSLVGGKPYMRGIHEPFADVCSQRVEENHEDLCRLEARVWDSIRSVIDLSVQLGVDPVVARDTFANGDTSETSSSDTNNDMDKGTIHDVDIQGDDRRAIYEDEVNLALKRAGERLGQSTDIVRRLEALSFAAFMVIDVSLSAKQKALECKDTIVRVDLILKQLEEKKNQLAAKLAVKKAFVSKE